MDEIFTEQLRRLATADQDKEDAFCAWIVDNARAQARDTVAHYQGSDAELSQTAFGVLLGIQEAAILPIVEAPVPRDPKERVRSLNVAVDAELALRRKLLARIDALLDDKTLVPPPPVLGNVEEKPRPSRVCDEAFLAMRRLVHFGEADSKRIDSRFDLLLLSDADKDAAIAHARETNVWTRIISGRRDIEDDELEDDTGAR